MALAVVLFLVTVPLFIKEKIKYPSAIFLLGLAVLSAFNFAFQYQTYPPGHINHFTDDGQDYTVYGTIDDWPNITEHRTSIYMSVDSIGMDNRIKQGKGRLLLTISMETTSFQYGDRIFFNSKLFSIKGGQSGTGFNYQRYLNLKEVFAQAYLPHFFNIQIDKTGQGNFYRLIDEMRDYIITTFGESLDKESSSLASGFLIGVTKDISPDLFQLFRDTGTLHLLAVSGSNVALVILFFAFLFKASPYRLVTRTIVLLFLIVIFSFLAYNQPSVVRASVMASLVLLGRMFQRRIELNNIIASTAVIILLYNPAELYDVGFQLSFITAWGLIYFIPKITANIEYAKWHPAVRYLCFVFIVSTIAQIVSLPMSAYYFQRMPAISFVSNIIIVPLVSVIVIGEVILLLVAFVFPVAGLFIGSLLNPIVNFCIYLLKVFASDNLNMIFHYKFSGWLLFFYFSILFSMVNAMKSKIFRRLLLVITLIGANLIVLSPVFEDDNQCVASIFSLPGGIAVHSDLSGEIVAVSSMFTKDYSISEKIIYPNLMHKSIIRPRIISLSGDFNSVREIEKLSRHYDSSSIYFPHSASNLLIDYYNSRQLNYDGSSISYYGDTAFGSYFSDNSISLSETGLIFTFDSSLLIVSDDFSNDLIELISKNEIRKIILVVPILSKNIAGFIHSHNEFNIDTIICNRIQRQLVGFLENNESSKLVFPEIIDMSQIGVVDLFIENGKIQMGR